MRHDNRSKVVVLARREASISTGRVMTLKSVVMANKPMPKSKRAGNVCTSKMPASRIHDTTCEAIETTGTRAERRRKGP